MPKNKKNKGANYNNEINPVDEVKQKELELQRKHNPNISDDGDWEEVVDVKKMKQQARIAKKQVETAKTALPSEQEEKAMILEKSNDRDDYVFKKSNTSNGSNKNHKSKSDKKKGGDPNAPKRPNNEEEMVELISSILESTPQGYLAVSAVGDKIQTLTKCAWNKTFKPTYGTLKDFIAKTPAFHFDPQFERVSVASGYQQVAAQKTAESQTKSAKTANKKAQQQEHNSNRSTKPNSSHATEKAQQDEDEDDEETEEAPRAKLRQHRGSNSGGSSESSHVFMVLLLFSALAFFTWFIVSGGDVNAIKGRIQSFFSPRS